uniref:non-specific serine/threonine protein kinase n=1 Tax=Denticeps clupeoides TaxID=299321 RepID=A0AAY4BZW9_9TELE
MDFEFLECIGHGGFGQVFKAVNQQSNEILAIKSVHLNNGDDVKPMEEGRLLKECNHENLIKFHGVYRLDQESGNLFIAMEFCGGGSLYDLYKYLGPFCNDEVAYVCREVLKGLKYLHGKSLIHRDIKGQNILVNETGKVKIGDLGLAARVSDLSARFQRVGTYDWMAPEVSRVKFVGPYNEKCDIWSLGMMTMEIAEAQIPSIDLRRNGNWSRECHDFIRRLLVFNPSRRPSAEELLLHPFVNGSHLTQCQMNRRLKCQELYKMLDKSLQPGHEEVQEAGCKAEHVVKGTHGGRQQPGHVEEQGHGEGQEPGRGEGQEPGRGEGQEPGRAEGQEPG